MSIPFSKTSTTSIVAVLLTICSFGSLGFLLVEFGDDATTRTQIITGVFGLMAGVVGYYFGSSKQRTPSINADSVGTVNTGSSTDTGLDDNK